MIDHRGGVNPAELPSVLDRLGDVLGGPFDLVEQPSRLGGGFWAEMWTLRLRRTVADDARRLVLRLSPDAVLGARERIVQQGVAEQGYPTPMILAHGEAQRPSRYWSVMEFASGQPLLAGLSGASAIIRLPSLMRDLPLRLASAAGRLHALDPGPIEAKLAQTSNQRLGVGGLVEHFESLAADLEDPLLTRAVAQLARTQREPTRVALCHGDLHPFNVLRNGRQNTVLDWTAAQVADPSYDVAFTALLLANPPLEAPRAVRPALRRVSVVLSRRFVRAYEESVDWPLARTQLAWHDMLHTVRILLDVGQWQANDEVDARRAHPWLTIANDLREGLARSLG